MTLLIYWEINLISGFLRPVDICMIKIHSMFVHHGCGCLVTTWPTQHAAHKYPIGNYHCRVQILLCKECEIPLGSKVLYIIKTVLWAI